MIRLRLGYKWNVNFADVSELIFTLPQNMCIVE